jgi:hypothetical protein
MYRYDVLRKRTEHGGAYTDWREPLADVSIVRCNDHDGKGLPAVLPATGDYLAEVVACSGSDLQDDYTYRANHDGIAEDFGDCDWLKRIEGGHGTYGIALDVRAFLADESGRADEFVDNVLERLYNYPVYDDERASKLEREWIDEAWNDWASADFQHAIKKAFDVDLDICTDDSKRTIYRGPELFDTGRPEQWEEYNAPNNYTALRRLFEDFGAEWYPEGSGMYVNIDRVVDALDYDDIAPFVADWSKPEIEAEAA